MTERDHADGQFMCPGPDAFLSDTDLGDDEFRELVATRASRLIHDLGNVSTDAERRHAESEIERYFEKIDQGADFLPASFLSDGATRARAVCRIAVPGGYGTGFLIAPGLIMTNNHVIESSQSADESVAEFGLDGEATPTIVALRPERMFVTDRGLDFTIVGCDPEAVPPHTLPIALSLNPAIVTRHERVNIIQHPRGRTKEIAIHANRVIRVQSKVIRYRTDTDPGSSGSPVFNNEWQLVALHHAGVKRGDRAENEGIRISAIVRHLQSHGHEAEGDRRELESLLERVEDTSPFLGFFDAAGLSDDPKEIELPDYRGSGQFADVGFWNIEHFNRGVSGQRIEAVAGVVERLSMDMLGLVEVQSEPMDRLVESLGRRGLSMSYELLDVSGGQDIAILYDTRTTNVQPLTKVGSHFDDVLSEKIRGRTVFPRKPMFAKVTIDEGRGTEVQFIAIVVHLKAMGDALSRARRKRAGEILRTIVDVLRNAPEDVPARHRNYAYDLPVILGGDYNDRIDDDVFASLRNAPDLVALTTDDQDAMAASYVGGSRRSLLDHIVVSSDVPVGAIQGDDAAIIRLDQSIASFADRVSDHTPVCVRLVYRETPVPVVDLASDGEPGTAGEGHVVQIPAGVDHVRLTFQNSGTEFAQIIDTKPTNNKAKKAKVRLTSAATQA
ncbi:MAG: trypsin-like peptidase domain-containing protein [Planctomycetota bacterium]